MPRSNVPLALPSATILILALVLGLAGGIGGAFAISAMTAAGAEEATGLHGTDGAPGQPGAQGDMGAPGAPGERGERGLDGSPGSAGPAGAVGPRGETGASGSRGERGSAGSVGERGSVGLAGAQGTAGATGPAGAAGPAGAEGAPGPAGSVGPAGPAGADGLSSALSYTVLTARPTLNVGMTIVDFSEQVSSPTPAALHANGNVVFPEAGVYRVTYIAAPSTTAASNNSLASDVSSTYAVHHKGAQVASSVVARPIFNVNVALILTLRTIVQGGSYSATSYLDVQAGDSVQFVSESGLGILPTTTAITLLIERIS